MQRCSKAPLFQNTEKEGKIIDHLYSTYRAFNCRINLINKRYKADAKTLTTSHLKSTPPALAPAFLIETPFQKGSIPPHPPNCTKLHMVIPQVHTILIQSKLLQKLFDLYPVQKKYLEHLLGYKSFVRF